MDIEEYKLRQKFGSLYLELLSAMCKSDLHKMGDLCEKTMYNEFYESLEWITPQVKAIELINEDQFDPADESKFKITVVDFMQTFGAEIDRETNRLNAVQRRSSSFMNSRPNYRIY